ncbi:pilus assembly protein PilR [Pseudomonas protegens]|uniref:Pilus assembly protein PilR n=1 Tax=Pseudomonas protegens TaxID=380021 RepID=A0A2T6GBF0_9PSED|nr:type II secretion system F family protein [Pseudomonas protegens]PUA41486.1 pilus assembly protein PilR [Pseudomonas protegens]
MLKRLRKEPQSVNAPVSPSVRWLYRKTFSAKDRIAFYDMLAFLLDNDKTLQQALMDMRNVATDFGEKKHPYAVMLTDCLNALEDGQSALETTLLDWVPVQEATLIGSGILAGNMADALHRASRLVQAKTDITNALSKALAYPGFLLFIVVLMMNLITHKFIPQLARLIRREKWEGALKYLANISEFFVNNGPLLILAALAVVGLVFWSLENWPGRRRMDAVPPWSVFRAIQGVNFLLNVSSLLRVNIQVLSAVKIIRETANPWLERRLTDTLHYMSQGQHLGLALKSTGHHFPSKECVNQMLLLTDGDGSENILERYADRWLEQTVTQVKKLSVYLTGVCLSLVFSYMSLLLMATQSLNEFMYQQ